MDIQSCAAISVKVFDITTHYLNSHANGGFWLDDNIKHFDIVNALKLNSFFIYYCNGVFLEQKNLQWCILTSKLHMKSQVLKVES